MNADAPSSSSFWPMGLSIDSLIAPRMEDTHRRCEIDTYPTDPARLEPICRFLSLYFGDPPRTPTYVCDPATFLRPGDHVLSLRDHHGGIIGCIRYRPLGQWTDKRVHGVDAFCIHPEHRGTGVGRILLHELHRYANERGIPHALFIKEGAPLAWWIPALYRGAYVALRPTTTTASVSLRIRRCPTPVAHRLLRFFARMNPADFIVQPTSSTTNQSWVYAVDSAVTPVRHVVVCVQDTFQRDHDGQRMGILTACLDSRLDLPPITDRLLNGFFGVYGRIWMDRNVVLCSDHSTEEGSFHWYTYQWKGPEIHPRRCVLIHE